MAHEQHPDDAFLWALAAGEPVEDAGVSAHVDACAACRSRVQQRVAMRAVVQQARPPQPGAGARMTQLLRVEESLARERERQAFWWARRGWLAPAFGVAMSAGAAFALWMDQEPPPPNWRAAGDGVAALAPVPSPPASPVNPALLEAMPGEPVVGEPTPAAVAVAPAPAGEPVPRGRAGRGTDTRQDLVARAPSNGGLPRSRASTSAEVAAPPVVATLEAAPAGAVPSGAPVDAWAVHSVRFPRLAPAVAAWRGDRPLDATRAALGALEGAAPEERAAALELVREVALGHPLETVVAAVAGAATAQEDASAAESLAYLACEAGIIGRRAEEAVRHCRSFAAVHAGSPRARDAAYVAGTLSRDRLQDCAGAVEDYSRALVFSGQLGTLTDDALFWRAWCREELGDRDAARADLQQFLARYPSRRVDPQVLRLQQRLAR